MAKIGYARVSTQTQDLSEQLTALEKFGCEKIFSGKFSGKVSAEEDLDTILSRNKENQAQLDKMLNYIREGDVVVVTKVDRLGRSLSQFMKVFESLRRKNVGFLALDQGIDTTKRSDPMAMAMIHLLGLFAELERSFIVDRTQEGKRAKIAAGNLKAKGGRQPKVTDKIRKKIYADFKAGDSISTVMKRYDLSKSTVARIKGIYNREILNCREKA
ncbi:recombinase family protein [Haemophilus influenzae]|uniref:recombinase family protein n=1 Tax=Haemophilus influenzae TaxID=727 RepID=UPI000CFFE2AD|nr:recombinase family protein [Haemophilus influenzae]PRK84047.1 DNA-invertase hin [Haemophilus influenzae]